MDSEGDLQIQTDISAALASPSGPEKIEVKQAPVVVFIGKYNYKKFLFGAAVNLFFTHSFMFMWTVVYLNQPREFFAFFENYKAIGNGYDIAAIVSLFLSLFALSVSRRIARSPLKFLLILIENVAVGYLSAFLFVVGRKRRFAFADKIPVWYALVYCGSFGLFVNSLIGTKLFRPSKGIPISALSFAVIDIWVVYYWKVISLYFWEQILYVGAAILVSCYFNFAAHTMLVKRFDYYLNSDWALGYAHLQTYFVFYLWFDWMFLKKGAPRDFNLHAENHVPNKSEKEIDN